MKSLAQTALVAVALGTTFTPATPQQFAQGFGDLYLTMDLAVDPFDPIEGPASICITDPGLAPFSILEFFLVVRLNFADIGQPGWNLSNGFSGWEAEVEIPPQLTITARTLQPPGSVNVGEGSTNNWIVGTGVNIIANDTPYAVVEYSSILLAPAQDLMLSLGPSQPSSFSVAGGPGSVPGWLEGVPTGDCLANGNPRKCLRAFSRWDGCQDAFMINYTGPGGCACRCWCDATEDTSWGALKSRF